MRMDHELQAGERRLVDEAFSRALELSGEERSRYLARACAGDARLRRRIEALLAAAEANGGPFERSFDAARDRLLRAMLADREHAEDELAGQRIGPWRVERRIARGGLATVYLARRDDGQFDQLVAIKVLRRGLDTDDVVSRFRAERRILSSLEHPSIARLLDGGGLADGRPYLVLEFVDGEPITDWCAAKDTSLRGRVGLMIEVLRALHHAHARLVVHRDVKPSNILVSDGGSVKLLDFGIAKLIDPSEATLAPALTRTGVALLTPGYGSPEQHAGEPVTTASDIYQAGLVLYQLVTGKRPFDGKPLEHAFLLPPPSEALQGTPAYRAVRGDLDAVVAKATQVDPSRRYGSADEMALDLSRYLDGRPVMAQPDSVGYRLRRLASRRPWLLPVVSLGALSVIAYVVTLTVYTARLDREQKLAASARQFMEDLFSSPDPFAPADPERGLNIRVVEALDLGQRRVRSELSDQPQLRATLLGSIAAVYASLDQHRQAIALREEALELEQSLYGPRSVQVVESLRVLGSLNSTAGDLERADDLLRRQLELARLAYPAGSSELARSEIAYALHKNRLGELQDSQAMLLSGIERLRAQPAADAQLLVQALVTLEQQRSAAAAPLGFDPLGEAEAVARTAFGSESVQVALVRLRRASSLTNSGDYAAAEEIFRAVIPLLEDKLGREHGTTLGALNNLGYLHHRRGDLAGAERIHAELVRRNVAKHGAAHRAVADSYQNLAGALTHQARYDESLPLHQQAYDLFRQVLNDDNYVIAIPLLSIAYVQLQRGEAAAAEAAAREAMLRLQPGPAANHLQGVARCLLGLSLERQGHTKDGAALIAESHQLMTGASIPDPYPTLCRLPAARTR